MGILRDYLGHVYKMTELGLQGEQKIDQLDTEYEHKGNLQTKAHNDKVAESMVQHANKLEEQRYDHASRLLEQGNQTALSKSLESHKSEMRQKEMVIQKALDVQKRSDTYWYDIGEDAVKGLFGIGGAYLKYKTAQPKGSGGYTDYSGI